MGIHEYQEALKLGRKEYKSSVAKGRFPYLPVLDEIINNDECYSLKQLAINGNDLIKLGYEDKKIGEMLNTLLNIVIDDNYLNNKESLLNIINNLK